MITVLAVCLRCFFDADSGLYVVGSSVNGFGSNESDMDMCLMLTNNEVMFNSNVNAQKIKLAQAYIPRSRAECCVAAFAD